MKAVIFGAGNIGRGFIGALFSHAGYEVTFIDVCAPIVAKLNEDHCYPLTIVSSEGSHEESVTNVSAVDGNDADAAARVIADCDIAATCVGAKAIKYILPNFVRGARLRFAESDRPLNLLICENLMDADKYIRGLLSEMLSEDELAKIGLVETSVGRMVPVPKPEMQGDNILRVAVEEYNVLPVDLDAFVGEVPEAKNMAPFSPFHFYIERKLYIHNMGHAICAYLGDYLGHEYICTAISDPAIRLCVLSAMNDSAAALSKKYGSDIVPITDHVGDLIRRFSNTALGDTCARVGGDIPRKLALSDRLTGAYLQASGEGLFPVFICVGAAAALVKYCAENEKTDLAATLSELCSLDADHEYCRTVLHLAPLFAEGKSLAEIIAFADTLKHEHIGMIV